MTLSNPIKLLADGLAKHPFDRDGYVLVDPDNQAAAVVELVYKPMVFGENTVYLTGLQALRPGGGNELMSHVIENAMDHGISITLKPDPLPVAIPGAAIKMSKKRLTDWYKSFGFEKGDRDRLTYAPNPPSDLEMVSFEDQEGGFWQTGVPIGFPYAHNTESSPYMGSTYGQDIEPAGFYMITGHDPGHPLPGWEDGDTSFGSPLVLAHRGYGPDGWKQRLSDHFDGLAGADLSSALLRDGYDGIVTISMKGDTPVDVSEIIDLRVVK